MSECSNCEGLGYCMAFDGRRFPCECQAPRMDGAAAAAAKLGRALSKTGIPPRYQRKTFQEYDTKKSRSAAEALMICNRFVEEWPLDRSSGLVLTGPVGVGKTHLATVVLLECRQRYNATVAFVDLPQLFSDIKATFDAKWIKTEREILAPLIDAEILMIDEVGAARHSDWNFAMTEHLINSRYNADRSTLITTNFANRPLGWVGTTAEPRPLQLVSADKFSFAKHADTLSSIVGIGRQETLGDRIGARMFSRVQEMCRAIEVDSEDRRAEMGQKRRQG